MLALNPEDFLKQELEIQKIDQSSKANKANETEFYIVFVFPSNERATRFLLQAELDPSQRFQAGTWLEQKFDVQVDD